MNKLERSARTDIVIVNWNSGEFLSNCLDSLQKEALCEIHKVIVVDNNSSDNSLKKMKEYSFELDIVKNDVNCGFGAACNQGAKLCKSDYILFLNPDMPLLTNI